MVGYELGKDSVDAGSGSQSVEESKEGALENRMQERWEGAEGKEGKGNRGKTFRCKVRTGGDDKQEKLGVELVKQGGEEMDIDVAANAKRGKQGEVVVQAGERMAEAEDQKDEENNTTILAGLLGQPCRNQ